MASEARAVPLAEAARLSGVSVQALRQRIKRGTLQGCSVRSNGATVAGVELEELVRAFGQLQEPDELPEFEIPRPEQAEQRAEQASDGAEEQPSSASGGGGLTVVDTAVQGWREAREALVQIRADHAREVERLERQHVDAVRWGRGGLVALVLTVAGAAWLVIQERDRSHEAQTTAASEVESVRVEAASTIGGLEERARDLEAERDEARQLAEDRQRTAQEFGAAFGRMLIGEKP